MNILADMGVARSTVQALREAGHGVTHLADLFGTGDVVDKPD